MDPLSITASIIALLQLSREVLGYLDSVKDASKDRAQCAIEISNLHSLLVDLRYRLEEGRAGQPWHTAVQSLGFENGALDQFKQALQSLQARMTDGGRLKKAGEALMWKFRKEEVASILDQMERLKSLVQIALEMDHFKLSQAVKDDTTILRTQVPAIQSGVDEIRQHHDSAKHRMLLEWISASNYPSQQSDIIKRRQEGTGQWFLDAPKVSEWMNKIKSTLFCPGVPGAGKTMIAAIAIDHLLNTAHASAHGIAYVYCNYKAQEEQDVSGLLAAILKQLVSGRSSAVESIERLHEKHANRGTKPTLDEIINALQSVLVHYTHVYIVVDALDECQNSTRRQFLAKLGDLQARNDIRLMVTARYIPDIEVAFRTALRLEVQASREDVKRFIAGQIYRLPTCIQRNVALQEMVEEKIVDAADGMFLLARLHVDSLQDKRTTKDVKTSLTKLEKGTAALDNAYKVALQRINGQLDGDRDLATNVLLWVTFAKRPLTTTEMCCALAVEPEQTEIDPENVPDSEELVSVCAGLVVVDQESAIIRLVHYTTQEFLERTEKEWIRDSQLRIARTCLTYLCFDSFRSGSCSTDEEYEERLQEYQFLDYAAKHWSEHARSVEVAISDLACKFLASSSLSCAAQVLRVPDWYKFQGYSQMYLVTTALHELAHFGLATIAEKIASPASGPSSSIINAKDSRGDTPLCIAAGQGHYEMVKMLLCNAANINAQDGYHGSALQAASAEGHEQVVKLLLHSGADINAQDGYHGSALHAASDGGHEQVVKLLLNGGADINVQGGHHGSALQTASERGNEQVVKLLLNSGADINAQGGYYGSALQAASAGGHEQVVKLLLSVGADINVQGGEYGSALQAASAKGHNRIVKLLLNNDGAVINVQGGDYCSAL